MIADSKSQLAKLLATENIIVEQKKVPTAYFDTKHRKLVIPILADGITTNIKDLFIGHEVGHALFTPAAGWHDSIIDLKIPRTIINIVEDARIEKLIKRKYPGLRAPFSKAYRELIDRDFFMTKGVDLNGMNILDRLNMHFKGGASQGIKFNSEEQVIVDEMEKLETFNEVITVSKKLMALYRQEKEERKKQSEQNPEPSEEDDDYESETDRTPVDEDFDDFGDESEKKSSSGDDSELDESDDGQDTDSTTDTSNSTDDDFESHTDNSFREREKELVNDSAKDYIYGSIPENIDLNKIIVPYKHIISRYKQNSWFGEKLDTKVFSEFRAKSNKVVSYLVKEFEMRKNADQMKRASVSKTGELNMSKVYSYKFNDDIFKRLTVVPGGKSHGLVMFLDWSGSMTDILHPTIKQLLNLVLFCKKVNIPFEVYAFTNMFYGISKGDDYSSTSGITYVKGDIMMKKFNLLNFFSSKMSAYELSYMASILLQGSAKMNTGYRVRMRGFPDWLSLQYTPLNEAIFTAMKLVPEFQKANKLQVVNTVFLTDGDGHILPSIYTSDTPGIGSYPYKSSIDDFWPSKLTCPILTHKSTKNEEAIKDQDSYTSAALTLFKKITGSNVVGFYLVNSREFKNQVGRFYPPTANHEQIRANFMKDKNVVCTSSGYDEFYILRAETDVDEDSELQIKSTTTRSLVSAFTKYNTNKVTNRVVLNKFIGMIT